MISFIRKLIFPNPGKNNAAPHVFITLCFYAIATSVYTSFFFDTAATLMRIVFCIMLILIFVLLERSQLSATITAFLSPTLIAVIVIIGAVYFEGDSLAFIYICCVSFISLTYFDLKGLILYIIAVAVIVSVVLFILNINLLGSDFTMLYNIISFVAVMGLCALVCIFCSFCVRMLDALTTAKNEAYSAAQAKGSFLAKMSHEIRTPLNAIIGLTEAELRKNNYAEASENLQEIRASGNLLLGLINDILDMSKIESGKFTITPEEYDFADMIHDTAMLNIVHIGSKPIEFTVVLDDSIPCRLVGDALRIKQLLNNLLSNAFKYTHEGNVELHVSWTPLEDGTATLFFEVVDTGIGMDTDDLMGLFSEYFQTHKTTNLKMSGTGLGLSICKGLVDLMDGDISVRSEYGKGSVFSAVIRQGIAKRDPIGKQIAGAIENFSYRPQHEASAIDYVSMPYVKVLIVDDVDINLVVTAGALEPYQIQADCTDNGADAVQRIKNSESVYDLIFMDHMMPGMDGIETTKAIRNLDTDYARTVPIIALTANAIAGVEKMFIENGFQGFLAKPIDPQKLDATLRKWVFRSEQG